MKLSGRVRRLLAVFIMAAVTLTGIAFVDVPETYAAAAPTATATVTIKGGAYMRKSTSMSSKKLVFANKGAKVIVRKEIFKTKSSTSTKQRWYYVSYGGKTGYMRANWLGKFVYKPVAAKAKANITYRAGAGTSMKKKGAFKRNANLSIVLQCKAKGSSAVWYKVRKGSKVFYLPGKNVTFNTNEITAPAVNNTPAPITSSDQVASSLTTTTGGTNGKPEFELSEVRYPASLGESLPFSIMGKITCSEKMEKAIVNIYNNSGKVVLTNSKTVNAKTFDIKALDAGIKFGSLKPGTYKYTFAVYVDGKKYTQISEPFKVRALAWPDKIASTAIALAWPLGTAEEKYMYNGGEASAAFKTALNEVYTNRSNWGAAPKVGASCDVFVGTVCRYSGYDEKMPRGLGDMSSGQWEHLDSSDLWQEVSYNYKESDLRNGDIIIYQRPTGSEHICIYVKINGKGYLAEAAIKTYYGHISKITSGSKIFKSSDKKKFKVYRAAN